MEIIGYPGGEDVRIVPPKKPGILSFAFKAAGGLRGGGYSALFFTTNSSIRLTSSLILKGFVK